MDSEQRRAVLTAFTEELEPSDGWSDAICSDEGVCSGFACGRAKCGRLRRGSDHQWRFPAATLSAETAEGGEALSRKESGLEC